MSESLRSHHEQVVRYEGETPEAAPPVSSVERREGPNAENEAMYRLPGDARLTEKDFSRYRVAMEVFHLDVRDESDRLLESGDYRERLKGGALLGQGETAPEQLENDVMHELNLQSMEAYADAMRTVAKLAPDARERVFGAVFSDPDMEFMRGNMINDAHVLAPEQRRTWLERALRGTSSVVHSSSGTYKYLPSRDLTAMLPEYMAKGIYAHEQLRLLPELPEAAQAEALSAFIGRGEARHLRLLERVAPRLAPAALEKSADAISALLHQEASLLTYPELLSRAADGKQFEARMATETFGAVRKIFSEIDAGRNGAAAFEMEKLPSSVALELMRRLFASGKESDGALRAALAGMRAMSPEERAAFVGEHPAFFERLERDLTRTPLYGKAPSKYFAAEFQKGGSKTTLLDTVPGMPDASLKNRVIVRRVADETIPGWQRAYEAAGFWKAKGFDYVPVEPIVNVRAHHGSGEASVAARVLPGVALGKWDMTTLYTKELTEMRDRIKRGLEQLGVKHGHDHDLNFVTVLERDADGKADFTKPPRLYVIDFDRSETFEPADPVPGVSGT